MRGASGLSRGLILAMAAVFPVMTVSIPASGATTGPGTSTAARPPTARDDASRGYRPGDYWQFNASVWRATGTAAQAARWTRVPVHGRPADPFGPGALFAGGTTQMVAGYVGPAIDVDVVRGGRHDVETIALTARGALDMSALDRLMNTRDPGSYLSLVRVYDQTGHHAHLVAAPAPGAIHVGEVSVNGTAALSWGEANGAGGLMLPSSLKLPREHFFFGAMGGFASSNAASGAYPVPVMLGSQGASNEVKAVLGGYTLDGFVHIVDHENVDHLSNVVVTTSPAVFAFGRDGDAYTVQSGNDTGSLQGWGGSFDLAGGALGYNVDAGAWLATATNSAQWTGIVIVAGSPKKDVISRFEANALADGRFVPQVNDIVVTIGDSRTEGFGVPDGKNWPFLMQEHGGYRGYNFAVSGSTTRQMLQAVPAAVAVGAHAQRKLAIVFGGINDQVQAAKITSAETIRNLTDIVRQLKQAGFIVALVDEAPTSPPLRQDLSNAIQEGVTGADVIVDPFAPGEALANPADHTYWLADWTHPNAAGHELLSRIVWEKVGKYLGN